ncbi:hypothetical protein TNCV_643281 [Trichonephila clavipes]|nr:hypothetical protein TNCV_643281 [Trichonephila clavipes]
MYEKRMSDIFSGREIRFSNQFSKISVPLPDNAGRLYFRHTVPGAYLKRFEARNLACSVFRDGQSEPDLRSKKLPQLYWIIPDDRLLRSLGQKLTLICFRARKVRF